MNPPGWWEKRTAASYALWPLGLLYRGAVALRAGFYRFGILRSAALPVPVVVVGNLTVGGAGKTPLVLALADLLRGAGRRPGIVTRGYKGEGGAWPQVVEPGSDPAGVGDEALLLARHSGCPVVAGPDRVADGRLLLERFDCDLVLSDDGFQHFALERDIDIMVIDGERRFGNGFCLPAGPLREPLSALRRADFLVVNGGTPREEEYRMRLVVDRALPLRGDGPGVPLSEFTGRTVHAVAGIGHPRRFFDQLEALGIGVVPHPFPDHHPFTASDLDFGDSLPVLMTEKDAVKCERLATSGRCLVVPATAELQPEFVAGFLGRLDRTGGSPGT